MEQAGMVHALEEIHRLLRPGSYLIDIHPAQSNTLIVVHHHQNIIVSIAPPDQTFQDIKNAEEALAQMIERGLFTIERVSEFEFRTYASSIEEMRDYIIQQSGYEEGTSSDLAIFQNEKLVAQIQRCLQIAGEGSEVAELTPTRFTCLSLVK